MDSNYKEVLSKLAIPTVSLGYTAIHVYDVDNLEEAQMGYSVAPSGASLIDGTAGSWQRNWIVIGYDDGSSDPIFIDREVKGFPVYTALHGSGAWEPILIATALSHFATAIREIAKVAEGRENPVKFDTNPIGADERASVLERILKDNEGIDLTFWRNWLT